jgi:hypothetical protein
MAMRSLPSIEADAINHDERTKVRASIVARNSAGKSTQREQQLAHIARCEARAAVNGSPFNA